jgi:hypothetical protein
MAKGEGYNVDYGRFASVEGKLARAFRKARREKQVVNLPFSKGTRFVIWCCLVAPFLNEQFLFSLLECDLDRNCVSSAFGLLVFSERKHAVLSQVHWEIKQIFAVFSSEQAASSFADHLFSPRLHSGLKNNAV